MRLAYLDPADRRVYFDQAALRRDASPVVLEKDFWVCWLLGVLFASRFAGDLVKPGKALGLTVVSRLRRDAALWTEPARAGSHLRGTAYRPGEAGR